MRWLPICTQSQKKKYLLFTLFTHDSRDYCIFALEKHPRGIDVFSIEGLCEKTALNVFYDPENDT